MTADRTHETHPGGRDRRTHETHPGGRDRLFLLAGLFAICGVAWAYTIVLAEHAHGQGFSLAATLAQWGLHDVALVSAEGAIRESYFAGALLLAAGGFQLTPLKQACLTRCRSPLLFLMTGWRPGAWGGLHMGILHGVNCLGCCWALMLLMFVGGTMNLLWCAGLMVLMLAEKLLPPGRAISHGAGVALMIWGSYALFAGSTGS